jgi:hypothetical protein
VPSHPRRLPRSVRVSVNWQAKGRQALTVALVKPARGSRLYQAKNSSSPRLYTRRVIGEETLSSTSARTPRELVSRLEAGRDCVHQSVGVQGHEWRRYSLAGNCPCGTGDVSGQLPAALTFENGVGFNDYFDNFTFGGSLSFDVSQYGPAVDSPDGTSTSGSTLAFSMFSDSLGTIPALTADATDGFAFTVDLNLDGTSTVSNSSAETSIASASAAVPEPSAWALLGSILALIIWVRFRRRSPRRKTPNWAADSKT